LICLGSEFIVIIFVKELTVIQKLDLEYIITRSSRRFRFSGTTYLNEPHSLKLGSATTHVNIIKGKHFSTFFDEFDILFMMHDVVCIGSCVVGESDSNLVISILTVLFLSEIPSASLE